MPRAVHHAGAVAYAVVDVAVLMAPSLVLTFTGHKGGLTWAHGLDLVVLSAVIGLVHGGIAYRRLVDEEEHAARRVDVWIASFDALVVLALGATLVVVAVLGGFATESDTLINQGWAVLWLWAAVLLAAIGLAELVSRLVFRWMEEPEGGPLP